MNSNNCGVFYERLDDVFSRRGFATYRRIRRFLKNHAVTVNGKRALTGGTLLCLERDNIFIDGNPAPIQPDIFIMMNKPSGFVCSTKSEKETPSIFDLIPAELKDSVQTGKLHTIGRLDADTEGLLIFTTNGDFSHRITMPQNHVKKTYRIILENPCTQNEQILWKEKCSTGIFLPREWNSPSFTSLPAEIEFITETECVLTISEGKYHQVKRMIASLGNKVAHLKRLSIGSLNLDENLKPGQWRHLLQNEICMLLSSPD